MFDWKTGFAAALAMVVAASPAEARRTVVDFDPDGNGSYRTVGGYCDFDGLDCTPTGLPYSIDFGSENFPDPVHSVLNYGDGTLLFSDYGQYAQIDPSAYYGLSVTGGTDSIAYRDAFQNFSYEQYTTLRVYGDGSMEMVAASCFSTSNCGGYRYVLRLTPQATGFAASVTYYDNEAYSYGYALTSEISNFRSVRNVAGQTFDFFVPFTINGLPTTPPPTTPPPTAPAVPEPATWMMLVSGFAAIGAALRRRRRAAVATG